MKINILTLILLIAHQFCQAQKEPVGVIIDFYPSVSTAEKQALIEQEEFLKPLRSGNELTGFEVTLVEGLDGLETSDYHLICEHLKSSETVQFVSALYKTDHGSYGGDLKEMFLKPNAQDWLEVIPAGVFDKILPHHSLENVYVASTNKASDIWSLQAELNATNKFDLTTPLIMVYTSY